LSASTKGGFVWTRLFLLDAILCRVLKKVFAKVGAAHLITSFNDVTLGLEMIPFSEKLVHRWKHRNTLVCVGLDTDLEKLPECIRSEKYPIFAFNKAIIDATHDLVCCYKPQIAFYSAFGAESQLEMTFQYLRSTYPDIPSILDAKRGDIGSTAEMYAKEAFERYKADAMTVNPYLGGDTLEPFLRRTDRGIIILCKTSNPGSDEIQGLEVDGQMVYERIAYLAQNRWNLNNNVCLVVGGTYPDELAAVRKIAPDIPILVPGVGAQGGNVKAIVKAGVTDDRTGLIINSSRNIIYASSDADFADAARKAALQLRDQINQYR
jgi:orotidine-5'-phosphate decarboxylase